MTAAEPDPPVVDEMPDPPPALLAAWDQRRCEARQLAEATADHWNTLIRRGVPEELAEALTADWHETQLGGPAWIDEDDEDDD